MKKLSFLLLMVAGLAWAGDTYLGTLQPTGAAVCNTNTLWLIGSTDGGSAFNNSTHFIVTTLPDAGLGVDRVADAGLVDGGFSIPPLAKVRVQCTNPDGGIVTSSVCVNSSSCDATVGVMLTGIGGIKDVGPGSSPFLETDVSSATAPLENSTGFSQSARVCVYSAARNSCAVFQQNRK